MDRQMKEYFTPQRVVEFLLNCEREGINTHQFSDVGMMTGVIVGMYPRYHDQIKENAEHTPRFATAGPA